MMILYIGVYNNHIPLLCRGCSRSLIAISVNVASLAQMVLLFTNSIINVMVTGDIEALLYSFVRILETHPLLHRTYPIITLTRINISSNRETEVIAFTMFNPIIPAKTSGGL